MSNVRLIARLDIKGPNLIKGVHLEGLRIIGDPQKIALKHYEDGIDELLYMDIVASLYNRNNLHDIVKHTAQNIFVPLTVGGGARSVDDASLLLRSGADKIAINTAAIKRPKLIEEIADRFGS
jgi:cyclase